MNHNRFSTSLPHHASRGFTLIELMIVVIIVAILSAIAIPSYQQHTVRSSRAAAQSFMLQIASQEEKYALDARNYTDKLDSTGLKLPIPSNVSAKYTIDIINVTPTTFTVRAVPTAAQIDPLCGTLTVNQSALKTPSTATCW